MLSQRVKTVMEKKLILTAPPETTVAKAAKLMKRRKVGAVLVIENQNLVGIFTERDALFRVIAGGLDPQDTTLADVMTSEPKVISPDKSFGYALLLMHDNGFRHLPVLENGVIVGMLSARNAMDPSLEEFVSESQRREQYRREQALDSDTER